MPATKRPLTQREIKKRKKAESGSDDDKLTVYNPSRSKSISLQIRDPKKDFYVGEQTIRIGPGKRYTNRRSFFNDNQIKNLSVKREIRVISKK